MSDTIATIIVIDDDAINNSVCEKLVSLTFPGTKVYSFTEASSALRHLRSNGITEPAVMLLDIDMPDPTGWETVEQFSLLPDEITRKVRIVMLSSSLNPKDIDRARNNDRIGGYVLKPLSVSKLQTIANSLDKAYIDLSES